MFGLGDIVAKAGSGRRMMVVDTGLGVVTCAWKLASGRVEEKVYRASALVLIRSARLARKS